MRWSNKITPASYSNIRGTDSLPSCTCLQEIALTGAAPTGWRSAIGLQSSMEHVMNTYLQGRKDIHLAIGVDVGTVLVTRLGKKGAREVVCLGPQVTSAEGLQLRSAGREIRISKAIYESIDDETLGRQFVKDNQGTYVAKGLTFPKLDELEEAEAARAGMLTAETSSRRLKIEVLGSQRPTYRVSPKPWWSE
jgi:hypothetical protein